MLVGQHRRDGTLLAVDLAPRLGKRREEQPLVRLGDALEGGERAEGELEAAGVSDVLPKRQHSVDLLVQHPVGAEQVRDALAALLEALNRGRLPPVLHLASCVVAAAVVVEAVAHLVPQDRTDRPVVLRRRVAGVEEGRLQDAGRDPQAIALGTVEGVHLERRAPAPRPPLWGLGQLVEGALQRQPRRDLAVEEVVVAELPVEGVGAVRPGLVVVRVRRDADLEEHGLQLVHRVHPVAGRHPVGVRDCGLELGADALEHLERGGAVVAVEELVHVQLRGSPRHRPRRRVEALARPLAALLHAVEVLVPRQHRVLELGAKRRRCRVHHLPPHHRPHRFQRRRLQHRVQLREEVGVTDVQRLPPRRAHLGDGLVVAGAHLGRPVEGLRALGKPRQPLRPRPLWRQRFDLRPRDGLGMLLVRHSVVVERLCQLNLVVQHQLRLSVVLRATDEAEELRDALNKDLPVLFHFVRVIEQVGAIRQAHVTLGEEESVVRVVMGVRVDVPREEHVEIRLVELHHHVKQAAWVLDSVDQVKPWLQRLPSLLVNAFCIHAGPVVRPSRAVVHLEDFDHLVLDLQLGTIPGQRP
mmetsp:Transcript_3291/g.6733  ORF Transcript_3291/g.6733 Transcript_3291/m.6733 type:complete len:583 (+) Transcript_3291:369-2117(+)